MFVRLKIENEKNIIVIVLFFKRNVYAKRRNNILLYHGF